MSEAQAISPKRKRLRRVLLLLGPLLALAVAGWLFFSGGRYVGTDNAYVKADMLTVAAEVGGRAVEVPIKTNEYVKKNQLLLRIDPTPYRIAVEQAQAQLAAVADEIRAQQAAYREQQSQLEQARSDLAFQQRDLKRQQGLADEHFISEAQIDAVRQKVRAARSAVTAREQELARLSASLGGDPDQPVEQNPRYLAAQAQLEKARLDLARTEVRAPEAGVVGNSVPVQGDVIAAGRQLFNLVLTDALWVEANLKETDLGPVRPGQPAVVHVDTYPDLEWAAEVLSISPASGAEFSLLPAQNATGNWVKVVQRIPVRLRLLSGDDRPPLRAGMSVEVEIDTGAPARQRLARGG